MFRKRKRTLEIDFTEFQDTLQWISRVVGVSATEQPSYPCRYQQVSHIRWYSENGVDYGTIPILLIVTYDPSLSPPISLLCGTEGSLIRRFLGTDTESRPE